MPKPRWSDDDRQRHADRDILKARKVPSKRRDGPNADEWADDPVVDLPDNVNAPASSELPGLDRA
jgi:hypothetical protein